MDTCFCRACPRLERGYDEGKIGELHTREPQWLKGQGASAKAEVTSGFVSMFRQTQHTVGSTNRGMGRSLRLRCLELAERSKGFWLGERGLYARESSTIVLYSSQSLRPYIPGVSRRNGLTLVRTSQETRFRIKSGMTERADHRSGSSGEERSFESVDVPNVTAIGPPVRTRGRGPFRLTTARGVA